MRVSLEIRGDDRGSREATLSKPGKYVVGRHPECDVTISHGLASKKHFQIIVSPMGVSIRDLDSTNGLRVDGVALGAAAEQDGSGTQGNFKVKERSISNGSVIEIGSLKITAYLELSTQDLGKVEQWRKQAHNKILEAVEICDRVLEISPDDEKARKLRDLAEQLRNNI